MVVENAGSIRPEHQAAMLAALGLRQDSGHAQIFDAAGWTSMPRRRTFLSTLAPVDGRRLPARRPQPWDRAWGLAPGGRAPAMLRARNLPGEPLRASTYQYAPGMLLYRRGTDWQDAPLATCAQRIRNLLPADLRAGWQLIERGLATGEREREAIPTAQWIAANGESLGFRTPSVDERSRAMGMAAYLDSFRGLGMDELQLFNAQGNSLYRAAIAMRVREALATWTSGGDLPRHAYPDPASVVTVYEGLRAEVLRAGAPACAHPFPRDLHIALLSAAPAAAGRAGTAAAEDGRLTT